MWSSDRQHHHSLAAGHDANSPELLNQEILRGGPAVCVVMSPPSKQVQGNLMLGRV